MSRAAPLLALAALLACRPGSSDQVVGAANPGGGAVPAPAVPAAPPSALSAAPPHEPAAPPVTSAPPVEPAPEPALAPDPAEAPPPGAPAPLPCAEAPAGMACVPAGWFVRGSDEGPENARPAARVWLQTFFMDIHEVTYAEYKACVKARACDAEGGPAYTDFDRPRQPINGVSWFHAERYCKAQGKRLPSEAQWEKAARGPAGELHPWGDAPATCERAIIKDATGRGCGVKKQGDKPETGRPWEVGSRPVGRYGLYDMSGNSWEWVSDWYSRSYTECGSDCLGVDPLGPCAGAAVCPGHPRKLVRGGSWYWDASYATGVWRRAHVPTNRPFHHFGFRCAASADEAAALRGPAGVRAPD